MKAFKLDYYTSWKSLPWNQINERIFIIQKKIYQASKACKYYSIHEIQNTLINSNEAKVLAIEKIFKSLSQNSINYNQVYYQLNDEDKLLIFYSLFQKQKTDKIITILREKIKQYLIYLCLQPEWEARFEPGLQSNLNGQASYLLQEKLVIFLDYRLNLPKNWYGISLKYQIINKYIDSKYINKRIQSGVYINYCLSLWLDCNYIEEFAQDLILSLELNALHQLLYRIICNGIEWFYSMTIELQLKRQQYNIYKNLIVCYQTNISYWFCINDLFIINLTFILKFLGSINQYNIYYAKHKNSSFCIPYYHKFNIVLDMTQNIYILTTSSINDICKLLFRLVKHVIYTKDFINRLRVNTSIYISKAILNINKLILQFYDYYCLFLPLRIIKNIYQEIDFIFYSWLKKRNKSKVLSKIIIHRNKKYIIKSLVKYKHYIIKKICTEKLDLIGSSRMK